MSEIVIYGRKKYLFTRPDGTYVINKPNISRKIFLETENINKNIRNFKLKKKKYNYINLWNNLFKEKNDENILLKTNEILLEIEEILKEKIL